MTRNNVPCRTPPPTGCSSIVQHDATIHRGAARRNNTIQAQQDAAVWRTKTQSFYRGAFRRNNVARQDAAILSRRHQTLSHAIKDAAAHPRGAGDGRGGLRRGWGRIWRAPCRPTTPSWRCAEEEEEGDCAAQSTSQCIMMMMTTKMISSSNSSNNGDGDSKSALLMMRVAI